MKNMIRRIALHTISIIWMLSFISIAGNPQKAKIITLHQIDGTSCTRIKTCPFVCRIPPQKIKIKRNVSLSSFCLPDDFYSDNNSIVFNSVRLKRIRKKFLKCSKFSSHEYKFSIYSLNGNLAPGGWKIYQTKISKLLGARAPPAALSNNFLFRNLFYNPFRKIQPSFANLVSQSDQYYLMKIHNNN